MKSTKSGLGNPYFHSTSSQLKKLNKYSSSNTSRILSREKSPENSLLLSSSFWQFFNEKFESFKVEISHALRVEVERSLNNLSDNLQDKIRAVTATHLENEFTEKNTRPKSQSSGLPSQKTGNTPSFKGSVIDNPISKTINHKQSILKTLKNQADTRSINQNVCDTSVKGTPSTHTPKSNNLFKKISFVKGQDNRFKKQKSDKKSKNNFDSSLQKYDEGEKDNRPTIFNRNDRNSQLNQLLKQSNFSKVKSKKSDKQFGSIYEEKADSMSKKYSKTQFYSLLDETPSTERKELTTSENIIDSNILEASSKDDRFWKQYEKEKYPMIRSRFESKTFNSFSTEKNFKQIEVDNKISFYKESQLNNHGSDNSLKVEVLIDTDTREANLKKDLFEVNNFDDDSKENGFHSFQSNQFHHLMPVRDFFHNSESQVYRNKKFSPLSMKQDQLFKINETSQTEEQNKSEAPLSPIGAQKRQTFDIQNMRRNSKRGSLKEDYEIKEALLAKSGIIFTFDRKSNLSNEELSFESEDSQRVLSNFEFSR